MNNTVFNALVNMLKGVGKLVGDDGSVRVYDYSQTAPAGYPYCVVKSTGGTSVVHDNTRDIRTYEYRIVIVGEKFGNEGAMSQSDAELAMRNTMDSIFSTIDNNNSMGVSFVIRTLPHNFQVSYTDNNSRIVLTIDVKVQVAVEINY